MTRFVYDGNNLLRETDGLGIVGAEFTYVPADYARLVSQERDGDAGFYHFDGARSASELSDAAGVVTDEYAFDAWGGSRGATGSTPNAHTYKGELLAYRGDPDAGPEDSIYSLHHRDYIAQQGRFRSEDPAESRLNPYLYCGNDPVNRIDPSGLADSLELAWGYDYDRETGNRGPAILIYYVDEGFFVDGPPELVGIQDPKTGFVRQPDYLVPEGKKPRWTTLYEIKRKTDERFTDDWRDWWNTPDPKSEHIYDSDPAQWNPGDNQGSKIGAWVSAMGRFSGEPLTPEKLRQLEESGEYNGAQVETLLWFYGTLPLEAAGALRSASALDDLSNVRFTKTPTISRDGRALHGLVNGWRRLSVADVPLPAGVRATFRGGKATGRVLEEDVVFYRVYGRKAGRIGSYLTNKKPKSPSQAIRELALDPEWGNSAAFLVEARIPKGTVVWEGLARHQGRLRGGGSQIWISREQLVDDWFKVIPWEGR